MEGFEIVIGDERVGKQGRESFLGQHRYKRMEQMTINKSSMNFFKK